LRTIKFVRPVAERLWRLSRGIRRIIGGDKSLKYKVPSTE
jgi:hypothetical protein